MSHILDNFRIESVNFLVGGVDVSIELALDTLVLIKSGLWTVGVRRRSLSAVH